MKYLFLVCSVLIASFASAALPSPDSRGTARVEREDSGGGWATTLVLGSTVGPDWGAAGALLYGSWQPGDSAVIFYPPTCAGCPSVCLARSCFVATVGKRTADSDPGHVLTLLRLPPTLPGTAGAAVELVPRKDGSWAWVNP